MLDISVKSNPAYWAKKLDGQVLASGSIGASFLGALKIFLDTMKERGGFKMQVLPYRSIIWETRRSKCFRCVRCAWRKDSTALCGGAMLPP